jgi:mRNA interferase MazF
MKRGDLVSVSLPGDYGKPRPALVIQSDVFSYLESITVLPLTTDILDASDARISISPTPDNGLRHLSQVMIDKLGILHRVKAGPVIGRISDGEISSVERALAAFLGFA